MIKNNKDLDSKNAEKINEIHETVRNIKSEKKADNLYIILAFSMVYIINTFNTQEIQKFTESQIKELKADLKNQNDSLTAFYNSESNQKPMLTGADINDDMNVAEYIKNLDIAQYGL